MKNNTGFEINPAPDGMIEINGVRGFLIGGDVKFLWEAGLSLPKSGKFLEIGSWMGLSTIIIANALISNLNLRAKILRRYMGGVSGLKRDERSQRRCPYRIPQTNDRHLYIKCSGNI